MGVHTGDQKCILEEEAWAVAVTAGVASRDI